MKYIDTIRLQLRAAKYVHVRRGIGWFLGTVLPATLLLVLLYHLHDVIVEELTPVHLGLRMAVGLVVYSIPLVVVYRKVFLPAIRKAQEEIWEKT